MVSPELFLASYLALVVSYNFLLWMGDFHAWTFITGMSSCVFLLFLSSCGHVLSFPPPLRLLYAVLNFRTLVCVADPPPRPRPTGCCWVGAVQRSALHHYHSGSTTTTIIGTRGPIFGPSLLRKLYFLLLRASCTSFVTISSFCIYLSL